MSTLIFFSKHHQLFEFHLSNARSLIGRSDSCDIALPGDTLSRVHCLVEQRGIRWFLIDQSRHGTWMDGARISRVQLNDEDEFYIGDYKVIFRSNMRNEPATTEQMKLDQHRFISSATDELRVIHAVLHVESGPSAGEVFYLNRSRLTVGGSGSDIVVSKNIMSNHCQLRVSRGRAMVEPGLGPVFLDGQRIQDITPLYADEVVRIGEVQFRIERLSVEDQPTADSFGEMIGESEAMQVVFGRLRCFAAHDFPVLILGESGTGKELAANGIHSASQRRTGPFVVINCGAIPESLLESELFGHVKGAFTGADTDRKGAFQNADGGTLFLDELGDMSEAMQVKLLRVLESGEVRPVGSSQNIYPDVRIVAATNADLQQAVNEKRFRTDLFFRLSVLSVQLPPLRERPEDIPMLAEIMLKRLDPGFEMTKRVLIMLKAYPWPGNVRELRNVISRAFVMGNNPITEKEIRFFGINTKISKSEPQLTAVETERYYLLELMTKHNGNRSSMARELGVARTTLMYRMKRAGLS